MSHQERNIATTMCDSCANCLSEAFVEATAILPSSEKPSQLPQNRAKVLYQAG